MYIKKSQDVPLSEITPREIYLNRRKFITGMGSAAAAGVAARLLSGFPGADAAAQGETRLEYVKSGLSTWGEELTPHKTITTYNNFYEFGSGKDEPSPNAAEFKTRPWTVSIEGLVKSPRKYDVDSIVRMHPALEERVYRIRCGRFVGASRLGWDKFIGRNEAAPAHPFAPRHLGVLPVAQRIAPHAARSQDCAALHPGYVNTGFEFRVSSFGFRDP